MVYKDQIGNEVIKNNSFNRIISLVPSQTELLIDLVGGDRIVGRTKFCIHPSDLVKKIPIVGGTKNFNFEKIDQLKPDLIIGNKEENYKEGIELLSQKYPVWISDIFNIEDNYKMINLLGELLDAPLKAEELINTTKDSLSRVQDTFKGKVLYFIWQDPFVVAGKNTFIHHMLNFLGFENECIQMRYPEMDDYILETLSPDFVFLSSEPYPFKEKHIEKFTSMFPLARIQCVDGEMFSWYGSRLKRASKYFLNHLFSSDNK